MDTHWDTKESYHYRLEEVGRGQRATGQHCASTAMRREWVGNPSGEPTEWRRVLQGKSQNLGHLPESAVSLAFGVITSKPLIH